MDIKCCICGSQLDNQNAYEHYCEPCEAKYGDYDEEAPVTQPMRKRYKFTDENN